VDEALGGQAESFGDATFDGACGDAEDFATADAIVRANAQPGGEVFGGGEFFGKARPQFGEENQDGWGLKAWDGSEVDAEDAVTFGTGVKARFVALGRAMGGSGR
jgi:hypothetical protein